MLDSKLHVLVLYDLPEVTPGQADPSYLLNHEDRPTERDVCRAISKLGFRLSVCGVFDDATLLANTIRTQQPDLIFNLCETFKGDRAHEGNIAALIELSGMPMTGSKSDALNLCKDKAITKKVLSFDGVRVPEFQLQRVNDCQIKANLTFPVIVKPLNREASEGIAQASVAHDLESVEERLRFIHEKLQADAIIEEFIHGRELYVGVMDTGTQVLALPPRELFMKNLPSDQAMVATYRAKWDETYRQKWGIQTAKAGPMPKAILQKLLADSAKIFSNLGIRGYARIDWRMDQRGEPVFLEANPNPALASDDDFAKAAKTAGLSYQELILQIISVALPASELRKPKSASF